MNSIGEDKRRIYGIRQVDDLLLLIAYDERNHSSKEEATHWEGKVLEKGGVGNGRAVGEICLEHNDALCLSFEFAGTIITIAKESRRKTIYS